MERDFQKMVDMMEEQARQIRVLSAQVQAFTQWMNTRKLRQLENPLDPATLNLIGLPISQALAAALPIVADGGPTALTQTYNVSGGGGGSITGPKAYLDTWLYTDRELGIRFEVPYVAKTSV